MATRFLGRRRGVLVGVLALSTVLPRTSVLCEGRPGGPGKGKGDDYLDELAKRGKAAMDSVDPTMSSRFRSLLPDDLLADPSKRVHEIISNGIPGQIGYGFLMGYSSGFCLKKVSKLVAFSVGGLFIIIQTLSFNGYMQVNYEKVEKAAEKVLDVNQDGKVDAKDAEAAYDKLSEVLGYHMPTYVHDSLPTHPVLSHTM